MLILAGFVWGEAIGGLAMLVGALVFLAALGAVLMHGPAVPVERPVRPWERR